MILYPRHSTTCDVKIPFGSLAGLRERLYLKTEIYFRMKVVLCLDFCTKILIDNYTAAV